MGSATDSCTTGGCGGGIYNRKGSVIITGTHLNANTAKHKGGGLYNDLGTVTFSVLQKGKNMVIANKAGDAKTSSLATSAGGGIYNLAGSVVNLNSNKIQSNKPDNCAGTGTYNNGPC